MKQIVARFGQAYSSFSNRAGWTTERLYAAVMASISAEARLARLHIADPYWWNDRTGRSVGEDELAAVRYARELRLRPQFSEIHDAAAYLARLMREFEALKDRFRRDEADPDGYGIGTLHAFTNSLEAKARRLSLESPDR